jgi:hypothetical protein
VVMTRKFLRLQSLANGLVRFRSGRGWLRTARAVSFLEADVCRIRRETRTPFRANRTGDAGLVRQGQVPRRPSRATN